jgi:hypothetical protein
LHQAEKKPDNRPQIKIKMSSAPRHLYQLAGRIIFSGILMSFETRISKCRKYIHIIPATAISYELAVELAEHVYSETTQHGIRNIFFDVRGVRNVASTENNYRLVNEDAQRIGFERTVKIGILIDLHDDSFDFIEVAANSAGYKCKIFTSEESLLEWIQI